MGLYIKIVKLDTKEFSRAIEELDPLCDQIEQNSELIRCFPVGGNLLSVIQFLSDRKVEFEIEVEEES